MPKVEDIQKAIDEVKRAKTSIRSEGIHIENSENVKIGSAVLRGYETAVYSTNSKDVGFGSLDARTNPSRNNVVFDNLERIESALEEMKDGKTDNSSKIKEALKTIELHARPIYTKLITDVILRYISQSS